MSPADLKPDSEPSTHYGSQRILKAERDPYRAVFDQSPVPMLLCEVGTLRLLAVNQRAAKLHGTSPERLVGMSLFELRRVSDLTSLMLKRAAGVEITLGFGYHQRSDGSAFPVQLSVYPSELDDQPVWLCVLKSLEEVVRPRDGEQERRLLEPIGRLAGGMAHDINNLLSVVVSFASLAGAQLPEASPAQEDLKEIRGAAERATALTKQLLNLSRRGPSSPKPQQLNNLILRLEKPLQRLLDERLSLSLMLAPGLDEVMADASQLERLLVQLVDEARNTSPAGNRLLIETYNIELESERGPERHVMLRVCDSGGSLSPELAALSSFVENGTTWLETEPGSGTRFVACFPSLVTSRGAKPPGAEARKQRPELVLVVQDNAHLRKTLKTYFAREGYSVLDADSSLEALRLVEQSAAIDLLLTDFSLSDGSGPELARALRQQLPNLKVLITTGHPEQRAAAQEDERTAVISKPFDLREFGETITRLLGPEPFSAERDGGASAPMPPPARPAG